MINCNNAFYFLASDTSTADDQVRETISEHSTADAKSMRRVYRQSPLTRLQQNNALFCKIIHREVAKRASLILASPRDFSDTLQG